MEEEEQNLSGSSDTIEGPATPVSGNLHAVCVIRMGEEDDEEGKDDNDDGDDDDDDERKEDREGEEEEEEEDPLDYIRSVSPTSHLERHLATTFDI